MSDVKLRSDNFFNSTNMYVCTYSGLSFCLVSEVTLGIFFKGGGGT